MKDEPIIVIDETGYAKCSICGKKVWLFSEGHFVMTCNCIPSMKKDDMKKEGQHV